jgi:hypothetical protein
MLLTFSAKNTVNILQHLYYYRFGLKEERQISCGYIELIKKHIA